MTGYRLGRRGIAAIISIAIASLIRTQFAAAGDAPRIDVVRVAKIATDYLGTLGPNPPHVVSLTLEKSALLHGSFSWIARWSRPVEVGGDKEVGLRVNLDGSVTRLIEDKAAARRRALTH